MFYLYLFMGKKKKITTQRPIKYSDLIEKMGAETLENIRKSRSEVLRYTEPEKYSHEKHKLYFQEGMDLLQYNIFVRPFIIKKFEIENDVLLDILLYVFPIQYFSFRDYSELPIVNKKYSFKAVVALGYFTSVVSRHDGKHKVYTLTKHSRKIVREYYAYLSTEKTLKPTSIYNPFKNPDSSKNDKKREELMFKLDRLSQTNPSLFTGKRKVF